MSRNRILVALALVAAVPALLAAADALETYDLDRTQVEQSIMQAFHGGWYPFDITPELRQLTPDQRAAAVRTLGEFARSYVQSTAFKLEYAKAFKASKPSRFGLPSLDARSLASKALEKARGGGAKADNAALDKNPDVTLARRLHEFLDATADVDFEAATTGEGTSRTFVKPEYEAKPQEWKMCFRAGREATEAARTFAQAWLDSLPAARR